MSFGQGNITTEKKHGHHHHSHRHSHHTENVAAGHASHGVGSNDNNNGLTPEQNQQLDEEKAQTEASLYIQLGFNEAGKEADNSLMYMSEWQKTVDSREENSAQGLPPPSGLTSSPLFTAPEDDNWGAIGNVFDNKADNTGDNQNLNGNSGGLFGDLKGSSSFDRNGKTQSKEV